MEDMTRERNGEQELWEDVNKWRHWKFGQDSLVTESKEQEEEEEEEE